MANLSTTQKKKRNAFVALLAGIVVVLAAIVLVVYSGVMAKSAFLENQDFATALSQVFGKSARSVSAEDLANVKYFELYHDSEADMCAIAIGGDDFMAKYDEANAIEDNTDTSYYDLAKTATFEADDDFTFADLKYFTGAKVLNINNVAIEDQTVFGSFTELKKGYFTSCALTDVSAFASLDLTKIEELNFAGNEITDWSALESIADKVIVNSSYSVEMGEDGNYNLVPVEVTLAEQMKQAEEAENAENAEEATEEAAEEATEEVTEEATEEVTEEVTEETTEEVTDAE